MTSVVDSIAGVSPVGAPKHALPKDLPPDASPPLASGRSFSLPVAAWERELRLDLFRGMALWLIFIDHLPPNILTWFTIRNYGFSDATEIFIFISGYTAAFVYGRAMLEQGIVIATARILKGFGKSTSHMCFCSRSFSRKFPTSPTVSKIRCIRKKWVSSTFSNSPMLPSFRRCC
jgi:hypothetical protein